MEHPLTEPSRIVARQRSLNSRQRPHRLRRFRLQQLGGQRLTPRVQAYEARHGFVPQGPVGMAQLS